MQNLKFFISYSSWFSDLKFFISCLHRNLKTLYLKFRSEAEKFRSEIALMKSKVLDLKLYLRKPLFNYSLCISSKQLSFYFLIFLQWTIMSRLTSGKKIFRKIHTQLFFELIFLFNCDKQFSKTVKRPIMFLIIMLFRCLSHAWGNKFDNLPNISNTQIVNKTLAKLR